MIRRISNAPHTQGHSGSARGTATIPISRGMVPAVRRTTAVRYTRREGTPQMRKATIALPVTRTTVSGASHVPRVHDTSARTSNPSNAVLRTARCWVTIAISNPYCTGANQYPIQLFSCGSWWSAMLSTTNPMAITALSNQLSGVGLRCHAQSQTQMASGTTCP